jgi:hypothetical protein
MNEYISKYSQSQTSFHRRDPFPYHQWDEDNEPSLLVKCLAGAGLASLFFGLMFLEPLLRLIKDF